MPCRCLAPQDPNRPPCHAPPPILQWLPGDRNGQWVKVWEPEAWVVWELAPWGGLPCGSCPPLPVHLDSIAPI